MQEQTRTDEDIKASNDSILKTVEELWGKIDKGEDCFIHVPDGANREDLEDLLDE